MITSENVYQDLRMRNMLPPVDVAQKFAIVEAIESYGTQYNPFKKENILLEWRDLSDAPKNATWFIGLMKDGGIVKAHYACDLSGEEQPPFQGFFRKSESGMVSVDLIKWMPLPESTKDILKYK